jgi:uncharacterized protein YecE (DUF72 family)
MKIYAGTSGYGYREWKGKFYPEKILPKALPGRRTIVKIRAAVNSINPHHKDPIIKEPIVTCAADPER